MEARSGQLNYFSVGVTIEALLTNIDRKSAYSLQQGQFDPKFQVEGIGPTNHSSCQKTRMYGLSCSVRLRVQFSFVLSQCTRSTDRQTDRKALQYRALHYMQSHGKNSSAMANRALCRVGQYWPKWKMILSRQLGLSSTTVT